MTYREALQCELARRLFWEYCKLVAPDFYKEDRPFLKDKCQQYQAFYESNEEYLIDNEPPRHGKSRTATLFVQWLLGNYPKDKIMTGSYNEILSTTFSKAVRNKIQEQAGDGRLVYHDIFPDTQVKRGDAAANLWGLVGNDTNSYLATSPGGTATGFGADLMLIDDVIKSEYEARTESVKDKHWDWFTGTMLSRREGKRKVILIMTRWASDDLAGRLLESLDRQKKPYRLICNKAWDGCRMLCDDILNYEQYQDILHSDMGKDIIEANYNQNPIDLEGRLYTSFQTYATIPENVQCVDSYTDTADEGTDYLCHIAYVVADYKAYIVDIIYTQAPMEETEPMTAQSLAANNVNHARIESNNGGKGFARNVQRITKEEYGNTLTRVSWFHQSKNKEARIQTGATGVMNNVLFPENWQERWPEFAHDITRFQRQGKKAHDDCADSLTGVYENLPRKKTTKNNRPIF